MTFEEAKQEIEIKMILKYTGTSVHIDDGIFEKCIEAVDKQIPKKLHIIKSSSGTSFKVCTCGAIQQWNRVVYYCWKCGQAIDWSDEE